MRKFVSAALVLGLVAVAFISGTVAGQTQVSSQTLTATVTASPISSLTAYTADLQPSVIQAAVYSSTSGDHTIYLTPPPSNSLVRLSFVVLGEVGANGTSQVYLSYSSIYGNQTTRRLGQFSGQQPELSGSALFLCQGGKAISFSISGSYAGHYTPSISLEVLANQ